MIDNGTQRDDLPEPVNQEPTGLDAEEREAWLRRLEVLGRAQARYLWILLVVGIFFLGVNLTVVGGLDPDPTITIPLFGLESSALPVWRSGSAVLLYLLLAFTGTWRATVTAAEKLYGPGAGIPEQSDFNPNALDLAAYTIKSTCRIIRAGLLLKYPLVLSLFFFEAMFLFYNVLIYGAAEGSLSSIFYLGPAGLLAVPLLFRMVEMWRRKFLGALETLTGPDVYESLSTWWSSHLSPLRWWGTIGLIVSALALLLRLR